MLSLRPFAGLATGDALAGAAADAARAAQAGAPQPPGL